MIPKRYLPRKPQRFKGRKGSALAPGSWPRRRPCGSETKYKSRCNVSQRRGTSPRAAVFVRNHSTGLTRGPVGLPPNRRHGHPNQHARLVRPRAFLANYVFASGTSAYQGTTFTSDNRTVNAGANDDLDLAGGLVDIFGNVVTFTRIRAFMIEVDGAAPNAINYNNNLASNWIGPVQSAYRSHIEYLIRTARWNGGSNARKFISFVDVGGDQRDTGVKAWLRHTDDDRRSFTGLVAVDRITTGPAPTARALPAAASTTFGHRTPHKHPDWKGLKH